MKSWMHAQSTKPYIKVLQQNDNAHVIACSAKQLEAAVTFAEFESTSNSLLRATDRSSIVIIQKSAENTLNLSVTDIDLADVGAKPKSAPITITVKGKWSVTGKSNIKATHKDEQTTLTIPTSRGASREFTLTSS